MPILIVASQTIAGGSGAGPGGDGTSGVHTHITNTRIGDVEILERRYPVLVHRFGLREGSGGSGKYSGGDGVVRDIEFLHPLQVSILSEVRYNFTSNTISFLTCVQLLIPHSQRRSRQPYGAAGGGPGAMGRNTWVKQLRKEDGDLLSDNEFDPLAAARGEAHKAPREAREINIGGKATILMGKGDRLVIETPGGGAWGHGDNESYNHVNESVAGKTTGTAEWATRGSLAERAAAQAAF